jgi:recombination protein RecT
MSDMIEIINNSILSAENQFNAVLSNKSLNFKKEAEFAIQILIKSEFAMKIAAANPQSVIDAVVNLSAMGLSLNPAMKQAYLVPRGGNTKAIVAEVSYVGYCDLATEDGSIEWVRACNVFSNDTLELNGFEKEPTFKHDPFSKNRGDYVGTFVVAKTSSGAFLTDAMSLDEINLIKVRSESVKAGAKSPWSTDEGEMRKKTVIKRASKLWPSCPKLKAAIGYSNETGEGIVFEESKKLEAPKEKPALTDEKLVAMEPRIVAGVLSADEVISNLEARYVLSDEQKTSIKMLKTPAEKTEVQNASN